MTTAAQHVLFKTLPKRKDLRAAISTIIRSIQLAENLSDADLGDEIECSASTVRNARNGDADLNSLTIARIAARFGEASIQPYADLFAAQLMPRQYRESDPVPTLSAALAKLAVANTPQARAAALPSARIARDVLNHFIAKAEELAA